MAEYDFGGYATRNDLRCTDGRIIRKGSFSMNDGKRVPLVWQHNYASPQNVLGHAELKEVSDGIYAFCYLNDSENAQQTRRILAHGDVAYLSICAGQLRQRGSEVLHGDIKEVSVVLSGANPGARIQDINFAHSDEDDYDDGEAIISTGEPVGDIYHADSAESKPKAKEPTVREVWDTMNEQQKQLVYSIVGEVMDENPDYKEGKIEGEIQQGDGDMKRNVFDERSYITHDALTPEQVQAVLDDGRKCGSLRESVLAHADAYGIENIELLFPDARTITDRPDFIQRQMAWVDKVMNGARHQPFSRIKSIVANITADEARARGYIKGKLKKEEVFPLLSRVTTPQTVYKKQKLDRDDIIDITDFDVVVWIKGEMRIMLNEEIARAALLGDGRPVESEDKIKEDHIRPIATDNPLYSVHVDITGKKSIDEKVEAIIRARKHYRGSGNPTLFTTTEFLNDMLLMKDTTGRRIYNTQDELEKTLRVGGIVEVEPMEGFNYTTAAARPTIDGKDEIPAGKKFFVDAILVNMTDYTFGADRGGEVNMFDDFDIDYNQQKYLIEARLSGALIKPYSALVIEHDETDEISLVSAPGPHITKPTKSAAGE